MTDEIYRWIEKKKLIAPGDLVLAGVSGGADSVCLLLLLLEFQRKMDFSLAVIHVEHGIRGEESRQDAVFVKQLCEKKRVPCDICQVDVPGYAAAHALGMEEAARILRYEAYRSVAEKYAAQCGIMGEGKAAVPPRIRIALAHHADDNAETILFQMVRGSGLQGLCGIPEERAIAENITVIRPLQRVTRSLIEQYLHGCGQDYRTDFTNADMNYSRNRIRHAVLPELEKINPKAVSHIAKDAELFRELAEYIDKEAARILPKVCSYAPGETKIGLRLFRDYPPLLQREIVLRALAEAAGSNKDIGSVHVETVCALAGLQTGRKRDLPYGLCAERGYDGIVIRRTAHDKETVPGECRKCDRGEALLSEYEISMELLLRAEEGEVIRIGLPDGEIRLRVLDFCGEIHGIPKKTYTKWLNYDKIKCSLYVRHRTGGDYLTIDDVGHKKKLKEYFIEEKIPREDRSKIWLLADGSHIVWAVGARISADYKINQDTERILEVQMIGEKYYEN